MRKAVNDNEEHLQHLTPKKVAELLDVSLSSVYSLIKSGTLPARRPLHKDGDMRISKLDLEAYINGLPLVSADAPTPEKRTRVARHSAHMAAIERLAAFGLNHPRTNGRR